ncbi:beta-carotene 15,15'-monooxygenase (Brp)-like protein [Halorhabdus tiamatea SARL4B]|uniref:Probable beta-carotene 15,15'-dioxygenase n=1 Tax=Halorhabdus tiamatea SARL4B TaxID=1033806 RepID=S6CUB8_9EURY|nr:beta-carotene 15,15'-monooxygenase (Brp)-like protein [Halorhabdus tiamatea SARL4B]
MVALAVVVPLLAPLPASVRYLPLVASVAIFGLPHGALDYVALPRALSGRVDARGLAIVGVLYAVLGGAYLVAWVVVPVPAAVGFIALTWFHWGQGELFVLRDAFGGSHLEDRTQQALTMVVRGGLPMAVPLVGFPDRYRAVLETFVEPFGGSIGSAWLFEPGGRVAVAVGFGLVTVLTLWRGWRLADGQADGAGWRLDATETALLWAFFLLVEPVLAVGIYFCLWHSLRHIVRVGLLDRRTASSLSAGEWLKPAGRLAVEALPTTVAAGGLLWALYVVTPASEGLAGAIGVYLVGIAVLTLPHVVIVTWIDLKQEFW